MPKSREYDIDTLSADGAQESPPTRLPASEGTIPPGSDGPFAMTRQPGSTDRTTHDEQAIRELHRLFFIVERLDIMAHDPPPDHFVKVTAEDWRAWISPSVAVVRNALNREAQP